MTNRRTARVAEAIRQTVSMAILTELRDPRIQGVTVIRAEVASDLRTAKVYVSILGDQKAQSLCLHGLNSARGVLQARIADRMKSRFTPVLNFVVDEGVKKSIEASRLLQEMHENNEFETTNTSDCGEVAEQITVDPDGPLPPEQQ